MLKADKLDCSKPVLTSQRLINSTKSKSRPFLQNRFECTSINPTQSSASQYTECVQWKSDFELNVFHVIGYSKIFSIQAISLYVAF